MRTVGKVVLVAAAAAFLALGCGKGGGGEGGEDEHKAHEHEAVASAGTSEIEQKTCPVMEGNKINPELFVDHDGRRIYFCCKMCVGTFEKDPEKYIKKVDAEIAKSKAPE